MVTLSRYEVSYYYSIMQVVDNKTKNQTPRRVWFWIEIKPRLDSVCIVKNLIYLANSSS